MKTSYTDAGCDSALYQKKSVSLLKKEIFSRSSSKLAKTNLLDENKMIDVKDIVQTKRFCVDKSMTKTIICLLVFHNYLPLQTGKEIQKE